jgi:5-formyltetrahydrofolate cyclo-ligase
MDKSELRQRLRRTRRALDEATRVELSARCCEFVRGSRFYRRATNIACYVPFDGEASPEPLVAQALADGKNVFLPLVGSRKPQPLRFARVDAKTKLRINRYGIPEPDPTHAQLIEPRWLDLVIVPLVAFDVAGNRLGMGSGFYDRTFQFLAHRRTWIKPRLVGFAFDVQQVSALQPSAWDIPVHAVATETGLVLCAPNRSNEQPGSDK